MKPNRDRIKTTLEKRNDRDLVPDFHLFVIEARIKQSSDKVFSLPLLTAGSDFD